MSEEARDTSAIMRRARALTERFDLIRQRGPYGRSPRRRALVGLAAHQPIDVFHYDPVTEETTIETLQDVEPILEANKREFVDAQGRFQDFTRVASIPNVLVDQWLREGINVFRAEDWPRVLAKLDDPSLRFLRTRPGTLSHRPVRTYVRASSGLT